MDACSQNGVLTGRTFDVLGPSRAFGQALLGCFGVVSGRSWALSRHFWSSIGACCAPWGRSGIILAGCEAFWVTLVALEEDFGVIFGRFCGIFLRIGQKLVFSLRLSWDFGCFRCMI